MIFFAKGFLTKNARFYFVEEKMSVIPRNAAGDTSCIGAVYSSDRFRRFVDKMLHRNLW